MLKDHACAGLAETTQSGAAFREKQLKGLIRKIMERKEARKNFIYLFGTLFFFGVYIGLIYVQKGDIKLLLAHVRVFSDWHNVQKSVIQIIYLGPLPTASSIFLFEHVQSSLVVKVTLEGHRHMEHRLNPALNKQLS